MLPESVVIFASELFLGFASSCSLHLSSVPTTNKTIKSELSQHTRSSQGHGPCTGLPLAEITVEESTKKDIHGLTLTLSPKSTRELSYLLRILEHHLVPALPSLTGGFGGTVTFAVCPVSAFSVVGE